MIPRLPQEIVDEIIYLAGLETSILLGNKYGIKKNLTERYYDWDEIFIMFDCHTIRYLHKIKYNLKDFLEYKNRPYYMYYPFDLHKLQIMDEILCNFIVCEDCLEKNSSKEVTEWININRPCHFMNFRVKHTECLKIPSDILKTLHIDVQESNAKLICNCLGCGGDGRGFV